MWVYDLHFIQYEALLVEKQQLLLPASAKSEIGFRKWTPRTDPSPHSP
jgi:hypothetical protein